MNGDGLIECASHVGVNVLALCWQAAESKLALVVAAVGEKLMSALEVAFRPAILSDGSANASHLLDVKKNVAPAALTRAEAGWLGELLCWKGRESSTPALPLGLKASRTAPLALTRGVRAIVKAPWLAFQPISVVRPSEYTNMS